MKVYNYMNNRNIPEVQYHFNKSKDTIIKCFCNECNATTNHLVVTDYYEVGEMTDEYDWTTDYQTLRCLGCDSVSFRVHNWFSEIVDDDCDGNSERIYPERCQYHKDLYDFRNIPDNVELLYEESVKAFNYGALLLCAVGLRALVEAVCVDKEIKKGFVDVLKNNVLVKKTKGNLEGKINGLFQKQFLTEEQAKFLHELRFMGNDAVHELVCPSVADLRLAFGIIESVLNLIYELPIKSAKLKKNRNA